MGVRVGRGAALSPQVRKGPPSPSPSVGRRRNAFMSSFYRASERHLEEPVSSEGKQSPPPCPRALPGPLLALLLGPLHRRPSLTEPRRPGLPEPGVQAPAPRAPPPLSRCCPRRGLHARGASQRHFSELCADRPVYNRGVLPRNPRLLFLLGAYHQGAYAPASIPASLHCLSLSTLEHSPMRTEMF